VVCSILTPRGRQGFSSLGEYHDKPRIGIQKDTVMGISWRMGACHADCAGLPHQGRRLLRGGVLPAGTRTERSYQQAELTPRSSCSRLGRPCALEFRCSLWCLGHCCKSKKNVCGGLRNQASLRHGTSLYFRKPCMSTQHHLSVRSWAALSSRPASNQY
jgi:hypothetical protein